MMEALPLLVVGEGYGWDTVCVGGAAPVGLMGLDPLYWFWVVQAKTNNRQ